MLPCASRRSSTRGELPLRDTRARRSRNGSDLLQEDTRRDARKRPTDRVREPHGLGDDLHGARGFGGTRSSRRPPAHARGSSRTINYPNSCRPANPESVSELRRVVSAQREARAHGAMVQARMSGRSRRPKSRSVAQGSSCANKCRASCWCASATRHPRFLERVVVDLLTAMGYGGGDSDMGRVTGRTGDGGIDGDHTGRCARVG